MAYDNMGRLIGTTTTYSFLPSVPFNNTYAYDAGSNRKRLTLPDGSNNTYAYDTLNRLSSITDSVTGAFNFSYDALSRRTQLTRPNGVNTNYGYDSLSHLLSVLHQTNTNTLDGATYTYDLAGNRTAKTNQLNNVTEQYTYDPLYQLTQVAQGATTTESYSYDAVGNRLSSVGVPSYTYNSSNELTSNSLASLTYDNNGNTLTKANSSGATQYAWDFENRLSSVTLPGSGGTVTFKYDPFGRRIQKAFTQNSATTTTNYLYDGVNSIEEVDASGNELARYVQGTGIDEPLEEKRSAATGFYHQDGLLSVTSVSGNGGTLTNTYTYDAFGNLTASSGSVANPFQYAGRDFDSETGLRYYRARYYDSAVGRFLSEDPIEFAGGSNFYKYVDNEPTGMVDPFGLFGWPLRIPVQPPPGKIIPWPKLAPTEPEIGFCTRFPILCGLFLPLFPMNAGQSDWVGCYDEIDSACPNQQRGKKNFKFTRIPLEANPFGNTRGRPLSETCKADDGGDDGDCAKEWTDAYRRCASLITENGPKSLRGGLGGSALALERCARGFVSERCGGNRIDWGRQGPPK